jgi:hypothetical protein
VDERADLRERGRSAHRKREWAPPSPELQRLLAAVSTDQDAMDGFTRSPPW